MNIARAGLLCLLLSTASLAFSETPLRIAVAANFKPTLELLVDEYRGDVDHHDSSIDIIPGATGVLYAQILAGAPFHIFLAADTERPQRLEADGLISPGSRFTYAIGQLAYWQPGAATPVTQSSLMNYTGRLAMANPRLAPYGAAAQSVLKRLNPERLSPERLNSERRSSNRWQQVLGNNVSQAMQFIDSGNAGAGFVGLAQLTGHGAPGSWWVIPKDYHAPLAQQAVTLRLAHPEASRFTDFLRATEARTLIKAQGYLLPQEH